MSIVAMFGRDRTECC